jgi:hypothetical protein
MLFLTLWLVIPLAVGVWHYGPGQERMELDEIAGYLQKAQQLAERREYALAVEQYEEALRRLPGDRVADIQSVRLERDKAQIFAHQLPAARKDLEALVDELAADPKADAARLSDARQALANAQYYMTWLLRLEGQPRQIWEPEIEGARQNYRLLTEQARVGGHSDVAQKRAEDLEASVRLARMDLSELQGLPLPSQ